jgi:hypothetical protein
MPKLVRGSLTEPRIPITIDDGPPRRHLGANVSSSSWRKMAAPSSSRCNPIGSPENSRDVATSAEQADWITSSFADVTGRLALSSGADMFRRSEAKPC